MPNNQNNCCEVNLRTTDLGLEQFNFYTDQWEQFYPPFRIYTKFENGFDNNIENQFVIIYAADKKKTVLDNSCKIELNGKEFQDFNELVAVLQVLAQNLNIGTAGNQTFRGTAETLVEMNSLSNPIAGQYIHRLDTETLWIYSGSQWLDTGIDIIDVDSGSGSNTQSAILLNTDASVFADGAAGEIAPSGEAGWYFENDIAGKKINWYFYAQSPQQIETLADLSSVWAVMKSLKAAQELPFINVYTKRQNDGNDGGSWFRSRLVYSNNAFNTVLNQEYFMHTGADNGLFPSLDRIALSLDAGSSIEPTGGTQQDEEILTISFASNSGAALEDVVFVAKNLGYDSLVSHRYFLHAVSPNVPNGVHETFPIAVIENVDESMPVGRFYGSLQILPVGKYEKIDFIIDDNDAGAGESCIFRFTIYDSNFQKLREGSLTIDENTPFPSVQTIQIPELALTSPKAVYFTFGRNDIIGSFDVEAARVNISGGSVSPSINFRIEVPSGALPNDITAGRLTENRIFYNVLYKR